MLFSKINHYCVGLVDGLVRKYVGPGIMTYHIEVEFALG